MSDPDLTCHCQHATFVPRDINDLCFDCGDSGRRRPTLAEWDALRGERDQLRAERDGYWKALYEVGYPIGDAYEMIRAALDTEPDPPTDHGWESPQRLAEAMQRVVRMLGLSPDQLDEMECAARSVGAADPDAEEGP